MPRTPPTALLSGRPRRRAQLQTEHGAQHDQLFVCRVTMVAAVCQAIATDQCGDHQRSFKHRNTHRGSRRAHDNWGELIEVYAGLMTARSMRAAQNYGSLPVWRAQLPPQARVASAPPSKGNRRQRWSRPDTDSARTRAIPCSPSIRCAPLSATRQSNNPSSTTTPRSTLRSATPAARPWRDRRRPFLEDRQRYVCWR